MAGKGSGKTTSLTLFALLEKEEGGRQNLFANYRLNFDFKWLRGRDMIELSQKLNDSCIIIDELHEYADSRNSGTLQNKRVSDFFLQSRHTHLTSTTALNSLTRSTNASGASPISASSARTCSSTPTWTATTTSSVSPSPTAGAQR